MLSWEISSVSFAPFPRLGGNLQGEQQAGSQMNTLVLNVTLLSWQVLPMFMWGLWFEGMIWSSRPDTTLNWHHAAAGARTPRPGSSQTGLLTRPPLVWDFKSINCYMLYCIHVCIVQQQITIFIFFRGGVKTINIVGRKKVNLFESFWPLLNVCTRHAHFTAELVHVDESCESLLSHTLINIHERRFGWSGTLPSCHAAPWHAGTWRNGW